MGRARGIRTAARAAAFALALLLVLAPAALASEWTAHSLSGEGADSQLFGISCPGTTLCVGVGGNNTVATSTAPLAAGGWSTFYLGEGVAAGAPNQRQIKGVSCPSTGLCVAVSFLGLIFTSTDPAGGPGAWNTADLDPSGPNTHFYGVSCPTTSFCVAVGGGGEIATSTNPTGGAGAWTMTKLPTPLELRGVSCASPSFCVAVGDSGTDIRPAPSNAGEVISSTAPAAGIWSQTELPGHGSLYGVSCPTTGFCLSGDMFGNVVGTTNPTGPASGWSSFNSGASVQITGASCQSPTECLMVDQNGDTLTSTNPLAGTGAWTVQNLIPYSADLTVPNALWSVSCPSPSFCAIGATGEALTSSNPGAPPPAPAPDPTPPKGGGKHPAKHRVRPKRPRVFLLPGQPAELGVGAGGKAILQFRFHVKRGFQVRGYVCSFGRGKLRTCRSPRRYRVGPGHYRLRVRAVGWTGLRGPVAEEKVWVCRRTDGLTGRCLH